VWKLKGVMEPYGSIRPIWTAAGDTGTSTRPQAIYTGPIRLTEKPAPAFYALLTAACVWTSS